MLFHTLKVTRVKQSKEGLVCMHALTYGASAPLPKVHARPRLGRMHAFGNELSNTKIVLNEQLQMVSLQELLYEP